MAGKQILVVEDNEINLRLTQLVLANEGYSIRTAPDAEEALIILEQFTPDLMLVDIQLPGMDGLELTRRVKANPKTRHVVVVAVTAFAMKGDEQRALEQGCDGYITKPIDTRSLPLRLREYLSKGVPQTDTAQPRRFPLADPEVEGLRRRFLSDGLERSQGLLDCLHSAMEPAAASRVAHQWIGAAGLFGYSDISRLAREVELLLLERPLDNAQLRESLTALVYAFADQPQALPAGVPAHVKETLAGRRIALAGFTGAEAERLCGALARADAHPFLVPADQVSGASPVQAGELVLLHTRAASSGGWLHRRPYVLAGDLDDLTILDSELLQSASGFLIEPWHLEEARTRAALALTTTPETPGRAVRATPFRVLVAEQDASVLARVREALIEIGLEVVAAASATEAHATIGTEPFDAAILDVGMQTGDGPDLLSRLRSMERPVPVLLLACRQQEDDLVAGLMRGGGDYAVKPLGLPALMARLEWMLAR